MENLRERFDVMHVTLANFSHKVCPNFVRGQVAQNFAQCNSAFTQKMLAGVKLKYYCNIYHHMHRASH